MAFLYAGGLCMTLLRVLELTAYIPMTLGVMLVLTALLTAASLNKWTAMLCGAATVIAAGAWATVFSGAAMLTDVLRAVTLHMTGLTAALPLLAGETALLLALLCALAAFVLTGKSAGGYPALMVLLLAVVLLWLGDKPQAMVYMLPAVIATVALTVHITHVILPLRRILPLAAVITVLAYAIVPENGVTIGPMKDAADDLRQKIFDYLFFTEPRNVFTLATEGFYPQGQGQLGGPATPDDTPVMMVSTTKRVYLRGAVKDEYTGRTWLDTKAGQRYLWVSPRWSEQRRSAFDMLLPQGALGADEGLMSLEQVSVRMVAASASSLFVPQRIRELQPGGDLVPYFNTSSEVFATRDLQPGDTYTVTAPLMTAGEAGLGIIVNAAAAGEDPAYGQIRLDYTRLPEHLQQELFDLAQRVTADANTAYDKAYALQTYLSRSYRYALDVELQPGNIDFVSNFLLNTKEGYCTYFASAMTVLCRMVGLPARYVEGYLAEPDANGVAYVTGMDAHAWTEVYFEGFGWLTFDATPAQGNGSNETGERNNPPQQESELPTPPPADPPAADEEPTPTPSPHLEDEPTPQPSDAPDVIPPDDRHGPNLWWLLLLLLALIAAAVRIILTQPQRMAARRKTELDRWMVWMQAVHDALHLLKLDRQPSESPLAHMRRLDALGRWRTELAPLGVCESLVFYGRLDPTPEETAQAAGAYGRITLGMPWYQKALLMLLRAFRPLKMRDFTK